MNKVVMHVVALAIFSLLGIPSTASAQASGECGTDSFGVNRCLDVKIQQLYVQKSGLTFVATSGQEQGMTCRAIGNGYIALNLDEAYAREQYALLLAAHMAGQKVTIRMASNESDCYVGYITKNAQ